MRVVSIRRWENDEGRPPWSVVASTDREDVTLSLSRVSFPPPDVLNLADALSDACGWLVAEQAKGQTDG